MSPATRGSPRPSAASHRVYLEIGARWVFACAVDWPGWCRRAKGEEAALETLDEYAPRYRRAVGRSFVPGPIEIVGRTPGGITTDFGAPEGQGPWDEEPLGREEAIRQAGLLERCWRAFDAARAEAPAVLPKGPRGGGRDRDAIADHVREAERSYAAKMGLRIVPRTPWGEQRAAFAGHIRSLGAPSLKWPLRYVVRRTAWHVLDHAWELEDKSG